MRKLMLHLYQIRLLQ